MIDRFEMDRSETVAGDEVVFQSRLPVHPKKIRSSRKGVVGCWKRGQYSARSPRGKEREGRSEIRCSTPLPVMCGVICSVFMWHTYPEYIVPIMTTNIMAICDDGSGDWRKAILDKMEVECQRI